MYTVEIGAAIVLMLITMLCWGSWANPFGMCRGQYRFELFYWDYTWGVLVATLLLAVVLGPQSALFRGEIAASAGGWALLAGVVFNIGNVLLIAAISILGMAVAFPVCIGLALVIGVGLSWWIEPVVPAVPMAIGASLILASMIMDGAAYRAMTGKTAVSVRGLVIAVVGGIFMGAFPPCLQKALVGPTALDSYAAAMVMAVGILACVVATNYFLMRWPIAGGPAVNFSQYARTPAWFHVLGLASGVIWAVGTVCNLIAASEVGMAVGYAFGAGGTLVGALWGVLLWKEFRGAPRRAYLYLVAMFVLFIAGIAVITYAKYRMENGPLFPRTWALTSLLALSDGRR